jgi:LAO/AO transport system kinase
MMEPVNLGTEITDRNDRALSRGLSHIERGDDFGRALLAALYPRTGGAHVIGITGNPGSGKSTLVRALAREACAMNFTVGIIAVDPSSPFTKGSILGDRIRMNDLAAELHVFIRSLATHGALGGLSRAVADSVDLMDAAGKQIIFIETVGVGQDEVDVMHTAHTVAVVNVPGLGDDIQAMKAGILEISDIHVVNKADREGSDRIIAELKSMLTMCANGRNGWKIPVLPSIAILEQGTGPILEAMRLHFAYLKGSGELEERRRRIVKTRLLSIVQRAIEDAANARKSGCEDLVEQVLAKKLDPYAAGEELLGRLTEMRTGGGVRV